MAMINGTIRKMINMIRAGAAKPQAINDSLLRQPAARFSVAVASGDVVVVAIINSLYSKLTHFKVHVKN
jgi:hypothetical protein